MYQTCHWRPVHPDIFQLPVIRPEDIPVVRNRKVEATPVIVIALKFPKIMQLFIRAMFYENEKEEHGILSKYLDLMPLANESS
jgi:hypothetical protein